MCRDQSACGSILTEISGDLPVLEDALKDAQNVMNGSDQERVSLDLSYTKIDNVSKLLTKLEEQMVPEGYSMPVPELYSDLPQLKGRATVEFIVQKPNNEPYVIEGKNYKEAKMVMVIGTFAIFRLYIVPYLIYIYITCKLSHQQRITNNPNPNLPPTQTQTDT